ncbi:MAG: hypothetical protein JWO74_3134 [Solirubrobacterales bacterium]|nr:hypothetical protein [Solirubrobacterales bacterium]
MSPSATAVIATTRCRVGDWNHRPGHWSGLRLPTRAHREGTL